MKILSISSDRADAHTAASALQMAGLNADVSTATGLREAAHWIFNNLDVAAIILDGQFGATSCAAFLQHLRRRCLTVPAILVVMDHSGSGVDRFGLGPHDRVVMKTTLTEDLGPVVQRAVGAGCMEGTNVDRLFDVHPLPLCRSSHDGVVTRANRAFATLFGCPSATEKRTLELASELFNSSQELAWLTGRTVSPGASASIECTRRKVDGSRLVLRLSAVANTDAIHIVVEDLTSNWLLQERLARAQRMEAVGRLAAEVSMTCGGLLRQVNDDGLKWVATLDDPALRNAGERMLSEVMRAAGFLKQLSDYGDEQASALEPSDLHQILHDLEPILQELAGDHVQVVIPRTPPVDIPRFTLALKTDRVERLLVNVAGYSRARMRSGGRMIFDVSPTVVDHDRLDVHPNVRRGPHVLLTVTEGKAPDKRGGLLGIVDRFTHRGDGAKISGDGPVVDFGTLQGLVHDCGGHLWMEAEPPGDTTIKIHLPLRAA